MQFFVLSEFSNLYADLGATLPAFTQFLFENSFWIFIFIFWGIVVLFSFWHTFRQCVRMQRQIPKWLLRMPWTRKWFERYEAYLFMRIFVLLRNLGVTSEQAQSLALQTLSPARLAKLPQLLEIMVAGLRDAEKLGIEARELAHWKLTFIDLQTGMLSQTEWRWMAYLMNFILAVSVGILIIGIYLPIFQLGVITLYPTEIFILA